MRIIVLFWRDDYPVLRSVVVYLGTDKALRGVLWRRTRDYLVLRNAELRERHANAVPMDGEIVIERATVEFIQVLETVQ